MNMNNFNPQMLLAAMSSFNTFKSNHPKFVNFIDMIFKTGLPEGSIIEISVTKPGEEKMTTNMKVLESDIELMNALKDQD
ncbi:MAG: hypothetical protein K6G12_03680 [Lachnospiraceae bacterium]|nr:hypothetical protein [Lachnospiraceae bacterium]